MVEPATVAKPVVSTACNSDLVMIPRNGLTRRGLSVCRGRRKKVEKQEKFQTLRKSRDFFSKTIPSSHPNSIQISRFCSVLFREEKRDKTSIFLSFRFCSFKDSRDPEENFCSQMMIYGKESSFSIWQSFIWYKLKTSC